MSLLVTATARTSSVSSSIPRWTLRQTRRFSPPCLRVRRENHFASQLIPRIKCFCSNPECFLIRLTAIDGLQPALACRLRRPRHVRIEPDRQRSAAFQRLVAGGPVLRLAGRSVWSAHPPRISRRIHEMNPFTPCVQQSRIRRIDNLSVGIVAPGYFNSQNLCLLIAGQTCPRSRGITAHLRVKSVPIIPWNRCASSRGTRNCGADHPVSWHIVSLPRLIGPAHAICIEHARCREYIGALPTIAQRKHCISP